MLTYGTQPLATRTGQLPQRVLGRLDLSTGEFKEVGLPALPVFASPTVSPNGRTLYGVVFDRNSGNPAESLNRIVAFDLVTRQQRDVFTAQGPSPWSALSLSPNGRTLVFIRLSSGSQRPLPFLLARVDVDGSNYREIGSPGPPAGLTSYRATAWTQDGRAILYVRSNYPLPGFEIMRISADGGTPEPTGVPVELGFDLAPDGSRFALSVCVGNRGEGRVW